MEINEYVRTRDGKIGKYIQPDLGKPDITNGISFNEGANYGKHSKDIIKLIEVGDYVNGYRVSEIFNHEFKNDKVIIEIPFNLRIDSDDYIKTFIQIKDIKSILTKEQFLQNAYTIEKER